MRYIRSISFFLLCIPVSLLAQQFHISGKVLDHDSKIALPGATVFIANSTIATTTDSSGHFDLQNIPANVFQVVIDKPGYETMVFAASPQQLSTVFRFEMTQLPVISSFPPANDSIVKYDLNGWYGLFIRNFLGGGENAAECYIANTDALRFHFNIAERKLVVTATAMLQVFNEATGYLINCKLDEFSVDNFGKCQFNGYWWFKELSSSQKSIRTKWVQNRVLTYNGSLMHFMRALYADSLVDEGFEMRKIRILYDDDPDFKKAKRSNQSTFPLQEDLKPGDNRKPRDYLYLTDKYPLPADSLRKIDAKLGYIYFSSDYSIKVEYKKSLESSLYLSDRFYSEFIGRIPGHRNSMLTPKPGEKIRLEDNGLYFDRSDLKVYGYWEWQRLADALPFDYQKGR